MIKQQESLKGPKINFKYSAEQTKNTKSNAKDIRNRQLINFNQLLYIQRNKKDNRIMRSYKYHFLIAFCACLWAMGSWSLSSSMSTSGPSPWIPFLRLLSNSLHWSVPCCSQCIRTLRKTSSNELSSAWYDCSLIRLFYDAANKLDEAIKW